MTTEPKKYTESNQKVIYEKVYENESESWKIFPKNKVVVESFDYEWTYENRDKENIPYSWEKVKIVNSKLVLEDNQYVKAKKVIWKRAYNDETVCTLSVDDFNDLVNHLTYLRD